MAMMLRPALSYLLCPSFLPMTRTGTHTTSSLVLLESMNTFYLEFRSFPLKIQEFRLFMRDSFSKNLSTSIPKLHEIARLGPEVN